MRHLITFLRWLACGLGAAFMIEFGSEKVLAAVGLVTVLSCLAIVAANPFSEEPNA